MQNIMIEIAAWNLVLKEYGISLSSLMVFAVAFTISFILFNWLLWVLMVGFSTPFKIIYLSLAWCISPFLLPLLATK